jgi:hypothetical protein
MLTELANVRQIAGESRRRWFSDEYFDLIVWYDERDRISGFQLCYGKPENEHALTWREEGGFTHHAVDGGENKPGKQKETPILIPDGAFAHRAVAEKFEAASGRLEQDLKKLVREKLSAYEKAHD